MCSWKSLRDDSAGPFTAHPSPEPLLVSFLKIFCSLKKWLCFGILTSLLTNRLGLGEVAVSGRSWTRKQFPLVTDLNCV